MSLNFYQLYNLINENTVSQELKKIENPWNDQDVAFRRIEKIINRRVLGISDNSRKILSKWIFYNVLMQYRNNEIPYMNVPPNRFPMGHEFELPSDSILNNNKDYIAHNMDDHGNINAQLLSKFNNIGFKVKDLQKLTSKYHSDLAKGKIQIQGSKDGEVILAFPDGYKWLDLKRGYCRIEGKAGKHCGNVGQQSGDTILSLRDKKNYVVLTFVLNNGMLEEQKANANTKPSKKLHPYIMELLKLPIIKGIGEGRSIKDKDFQLKDLDNDQIKELIALKGLDFIEIRIKADLCKNENTSQDLLIKIYKETKGTDSFWIIFALCENQNAPEELLSDIFYHKLHQHSYMQMDVYKLLSKNKNTPVKVLEEIAEHVGKISNHDYFSTAENIVYSDKSNTKMLDNVFNYIKKLGLRAFYLIISLYENKKTSEETKKAIIEKISNILNSEDELVDTVFSNWLYNGHSLPIEILDKIVDSKGLYNTKETIALSPNAPKEILEKLFAKITDKSGPAETHIIDALASNPNTPKEVLIQISKIKDISAKGLMDNPNTPEYIKKELIQRTEKEKIDRPMDFDPNML